MDNVKAMKHGAQREAEKIYSELQALGDEIRLKLHLAGAEGRDTWKRLEPQLKQFEQRVERTTEGAIGDLRSAGKELKSHLARFCAELSKS